MYSTEVQASQPVPGPIGSKPLSNLLWGIEWSQFLPYSMGEGVQVVQGAYQDVQLFAAEHFDEIYEASEQPDILIKETTGQPREVFYTHMADVFLFKKDG